METSDRRMIEALKEADHMTISFDAGTEHVTLHLKKDRRLYHDIALAYQTALIQKERR